MSAGEGSALVTGASRGIGRAIALRLARDGYEVIGVARGRGALDALRDEIVAAGVVVPSLLISLMPRTRRRRSRDSTSTCS